MALAAFTCVATRFREPLICSPPRRSFEKKLPAVSELKA